MVEVRIEKGDSGQRLNKFLMKYLKDAPSSFVYKMLRKKNIVLNDKKAKGDELLCVDDIVKLYLSDDTITKFRGTNNVEVSKPKLGITILYEDDDIIAVHKKQGVLSQKAKKDDYSINEAIVDYVRTNKEKYKLSETFTPSVCNRLDMNTSGIILAGISLNGSQYLSKVLKDRTIDKYYYTLVMGHMNNIIHEKAYISKDNEKNISTVVTEAKYESLMTDAKFNPKDYSLIETEFTPISKGIDITLVKVKLITGKSHQIRAHLKHLGYPIAGDIKYGDRGFNNYLRERYKLKNHLLHAGLVKLSEDIIIQDPLPSIFHKICIGEGIEIKDM